MSDNGDERAAGPANPAAGGGSRPAGPPAAGGAGEASGAGRTGGAGGTGELSGVDLARVALRAAKERARARGAASQQRQQARRGGLRSGPRDGGRDPLPLGAALQRLSVERGWEMPLAVGGVMGRWRELVGAEVAQHCVPQGYDEAARVLTVRCDSTAWATQLRLLSAQLVARVNADGAAGSVRSIRVVGPGAPARGQGAWRAPGSRGPGDTYG